MNDEDLLDGDILISREVGLSLHGEKHVDLTFRLVFATELGSGDLLDALTGDLVVIHVQMIH